LTPPTLLEMAIFANNRILFIELLDFFSLATQEYLPHPEYEAEDHQGDFRKPI